MVDDNRNTTPPQSTVTHVETKSAGGNSALWLVLGAVLAALVLFFLFSGGADTGGGEAEAVGTAVEGAADAIGDAAEGAATATGDAASGAAEATEDAVTTD